MELDVSEEAKTAMKLLKKIEQVVEVVESDQNQDMVEDKVVVADSLIDFEGNNSLSIFYGKNMLIKNIRNIPKGLHAGDILSGIITSDYQVRIRWGWMGFENQYWLKNNWKILVYPYMMVDVNHNNYTASAYLLSIEDHICQDYSRLQADWTEPKPMNVVVASFLIPHGNKCKKQVDAGLVKGKIGISIEHGGRKPKRFIGPYVTLCHDPWNKDAWVSKARINGSVYDTLYPRQLPTSILKKIDDHYEYAIEMVGE